jgi:sugar lactone lactonase YvrE
MDGPEPIGTMRSTLGEGPVWSPKEQSLYWVDIVAPTVHRLNETTGEIRTWRLPSEVGSMALRRGGGAVVALRSGFHLLDLETGAVTLLIDPEADRPTNRFNDGKCDRQGRFWAGTLEDAEQDPAGSLYRLDAAGGCERVLGGIVCSNGLGWSPDGQTMYHTDSWQFRIDAWDFDPATGALQNRRPFVQLPRGRVAPDGLTVDAEGCLWVATWDGWQVLRYAPDGSVDRIVDLPVPRPTSCTFGGPDLDRLYITSARRGLGEGTLAQAPLSGAVFVLEPGVRGLPEPEYAG